MAPDPLRALFLEFGVDDKAGVLALQNITRAADQAERALLGVATASKSAGGISTLARSNVTLAQSYNTLATSAARAGTAMRQANLPMMLYSAATTPPPGGFQAQSQAGTLPAGFNALARQSMEQRMASKSPWSPSAFMGGISAPAGGPYMPGYGGAAAVRGRGLGGGNYGLGTSIFLTMAGARLGAYGFQQAANLQRASLLASYASGQSPGAMSAQSLELSRQFRLRLSEATGLTQEVAQLGVGSAQGQRELARAGAGFHVLEQNVGAGEASAAIYRLIKATSRSAEEMNAGTAAATRYASAIYAAGNESAAGAAEVFSMVQELEPLAQVMNLGAEGTIALSAAFADLNANQRELFRGALTRMTIQGKLDPNNPIGSLLAIAERLRNAGTDAEKLSILKMMGFTNIRDVQTASVMAASMDTFARSLKAVKGEMEGTSTFDTKVGQVLTTMSGQWDGLKASMDSAAASIVGGITPALGGLLAILTGLADVIAQNPALAALLGIGAAYMAGRAVRGLYRHHFAADAATVALRMETMGLGGPRGALRHGRLTDNLLGALPFLGRGSAERFAATRMGMSLAEGVGLARTAGAGRMSGLSLGLMKMLPFGLGERAALGTAERMAAGGIAGRALGLATGPIGWVITALSLGAPLFERIGGALHGIAQQGGMLGIVFGTLTLIFDVLAAGGKLLNKVFGFIGDVGSAALNIITLGHGEDIINGVNSFLGNAHNAITGDSSKAGAQTPPASGKTVVNIYTNGSQSGYQSAIDEVGRRAARTTAPNSYGGIPVT